MPRKHLHMNNYEGSTPFHFPFNDDVRRPTGRTDSGYSCRIIYFVNQDKC